MKDKKIDTIIKEIQSSIEVKKILLNDKFILNQIYDLAQQCIRSIKGKNKVIFAGNGGSFADAQHLSAELVSKFKIDRQPLPSIALGVNGSVISAIGNDYGYDQVFARELEAVSSANDTFIPITTSGNSENIIKSIEIAKKNKLFITALTGNKECKVKHMCNCICVPSSETARIQESHILIGHIICGIIEDHFFVK